MGWGTFVVWIVLSIAQAVIANQNKTSPVSAKPGEVDGPTVDSSSPVPVLFGTRLMSSPNIVWYGDIGTTPIVSCSGGK